MSEATLTAMTLGSAMAGLSGNLGLATAGELNSPDAKTSEGFSSALMAIVQSMQAVMPVPVQEPESLALGKIGVFSSDIRPSEPDLQGVAVYELPDNHTSPEDVMKELMALLGQNPVPFGGRDLTQGLPEKQTASISGEVIHPVTPSPSAASILTGQDLMAKGSEFSSIQSIEEASDGLAESLSEALPTDIHDDQAKIPNKTFDSVVSAPTEILSQETFSSPDVLENVTPSENLEQTLSEAPDLSSDADRGFSEADRKSDRDPEQGFSSGSEPFDDRPESQFNREQNAQALETSANLSPGALASSVVTSTKPETVTMPSPLPDQLSEGMADALKSLSSGSEMIPLSGNPDIQSMKVSRKEITLVLNPESLGSVKIQMQSLGASGKLRGRVIVEQAETANLIQSQLDQLTKSLADKGIKLDQLQIMTPNKSTVAGLSESSENTTVSNQSFQVADNDFKSVLESGAMAENRQQGHANSHPPQESGQSSPFSSSGQQGSGQGGQEAFQDFANQFLNQERSPSQSLNAYAPERSGELGDVLESTLPENIATNVANHSTSRVNILI